MGNPDDAIRSAVPGGNIAKPLLIALVGLLASGVLFRGSQAQAPGAQAPQPGAGGAAQAPGAQAPQPGAGGATTGGLLAGLGSLIERFQQSGHGNVASSWVGTGPNQPVTPTQVGTALGPDVIKSLAQRAGMSEAELSAQLAQVLPGIVDKLTPHGRLPTLAELEQAG